MAGALGPLHSDLAAFGRVLATASVDALNRVADLLRHSWPHEDPPQPHALRDIGGFPSAGGNAFLASSAHIPAARWGNGDESDTLQAAVLPQAPYLECRSD